ncbi:hypothetical protein E3N88_18394 [Mikania micrantha]|uniref:Uncharacterized protein n=1 Tax=Mikania micrantha TaxID=192012 RepID=A0A5N6NN21_9ASTR|nr:hypothetical protein E3N88_18394 [Mikania micrantha]
MQDLVCKDAAANVINWFTGTKSENKLVRKRWQLAHGFQSCYGPWHSFGNIGHFWCIGGVICGDASVPSSSSRGVRGPIDRFMGSARDNEDGSLLNEKITPASAKEHRNRVSSYKEIRDIIDKKRHRDLRVAAYYLNPQYRWRPNVSEHAEIKRRLYNVMARFV